MRTRVRLEIAGELEISGVFLVFLREFLNWDHPYIMLRVGIDILVAEDIQSTGFLHRTSLGLTISSSTWFWKLAMFACWADSRARVRHVSSSLLNSRTSCSHLWLFSHALESSRDSVTMNGTGVSWKKAPKCFVFVLKVTLEKDFFFFILIINRFCLVDILCGIQERSWNSSIKQGQKLGLRGPCHEIEFIQR